MSNSIKLQLKQALVRVSNRAKMIGTQARRSVRDHPRRSVLIGVALVLVAVGVTFALVGLPEWEAVDAVRDAVIAKPTLAELKKRAKAEPKNADVQLELGHAYAEAGSRGSAVRAYGKALGLEAKISDDKLARNLVACFGHKEQGSAASLIRKYKITAAASRLDDLVRDKRYSVRWEAIRTLEQIGRTSRVDYVSAYLLDLDSSDCAVRRRAVEKLGSLGDKRVLAALRSAAKKDDDETPWYKSSCLGDTPAEAEKKILARR